MPFGVLDHERRPGLVGEATELVLAAAGLGADQALRVWVLIHEQPDGTWGAGGTIMRYTEVAELATD
ncbi:4-oxalocrotonate tautomerase family protein [Streptomyces sp. NPDC050121]|uniref:4-oxalocrotonate tautomerase family protein n=1 Tax=Streptomyces sp. NPDC050121 TaxID=3365601 RepID=UPI0037BCE2DE